MNEAFRLSRIKAPRSTIAAVALLILFVIVFGVMTAGAAEHSAAAAPQYFDGLHDTARGVVGWLAAWRA